MEKTHDLHNLPHDKLKIDKNCCENDSVDSYVGKENEIVNSVCASTDSNKYLKSNNLIEDEKEAKSSKIVSLLDSYCKNLNESLDFVECELPNKFKNASQKNEEKDFQRGSQINEPIICDICKEDITPLDIYNRGIHVNK